jgi:peptidoglycan/LPS O-acetylase OafA/YrhL
MRWIGRISYGLYLWQQLFLVSHLASTLAAAAAVFLPHLAAALAIATVSYYLVERRVLNYARSLSAKRSSRMSRGNTQNQGRSSITARGIEPSNSKTTSWIVR